MYEETFFIEDEWENVIDFHAVKKKLSTANKKTNMSNSCEYVFTSDGLNVIHVAMKNRTITFSISYDVPPFKEESGIIHSRLFSPFDVDYYILIKNIRSKNEPISNLLQNAITNSTIEYFLFRSRRNRDLIDDCIPQSAIFWGENLGFGSIFYQFLSLHLFSYLNLRGDTLLNILNDFDRYIVNSTKSVNLWLEQTISFGTTREIPPPYYFNYAVKKETYFGILSVLKNIEHEQGYFNNAINSFYQDNFNDTLKLFELGRMLIVDQDDILTTPFITTIIGKKTLLSEASSGTLQLLPILFSLAFNPKKKNTFFIQQPELHLHPRLQSELGNLLLNNISPDLSADSKLITKNQSPFVIRDNNSLSRTRINHVKSNKGRMNNQDNRNKYFLNYTVPTHLIIETHSEHLLKKLQVLVSQGKTLQLWPEGHCSGEDVKLKDALSIYYFAKDAKGNTKAIELELDDNGFFKTETPKGFFDESLDLNRQLLLGRN